MFSYVRLQYQAYKQKWNSHILFCFHMFGIFLWIMNDLAVAPLRLSWRLAAARTDGPDLTYHEKDNAGRENENDYLQITFKITFQITFKLPPKFLHISSNFLN